MFLKLEATSLPFKLNPIHAYRIPKWPTMRPYLFLAMDAQLFNTGCKLLPECGRRGCFRLSVIGNGKKFMKTRNCYGLAVTLAIKASMGSTTKSCPHVNKNDASLTEAGFVANNHTGGGGSGRFRKYGDGVGDSNGQNDNNGQGDIGGGNGGGGGGGGTGDAEGNGGVELRWKWRWWDWGVSSNSIFDGIATCLFHMIWNLKLGGGVKIERNILQDTAKGLLQKLVVPIVGDIMMSVLPSLLPAIVPAILFATVLAVCYYQFLYCMVSAVVMSIVQFLEQAGLVVGSFLSYCFSLLG